MRHRLNFDCMITEGAERWREVGSALAAAEKLVADEANDPALLVHRAVTAFARVN
jgi:hypothetical protein